MGDIDKIRKRRESLRRESSRINNLLRKDMKVITLGQHRSDRYNDREMYEIPALNIDIECEPITLLVNKHTISQELIDSFLKLVDIRVFATSQLDVWALIGFSGVSISFQADSVLGEDYFTSLLDIMEKTNRFECIGTIISNIELFNRTSFHTYPRWFEEHMAISPRWMVTAGLVTEIDGNTVTMTDIASLELENGTRNDCTIEIPVEKIDFKTGTEILVIFTYFKDSDNKIKMKYINHVVDMTYMNINTDFF